MLELSGLAPAPGEIQDLADACVRSVRQAVALELDYSPDTLPFLDHYIRSFPKNAAPEVTRLVAPVTGAYFGEVVRRFFFDCRWHLEGTEYDSFRMEFSRCFLHFNPMGAALEALLQETASGWNAHFQMLSEDADAVKVILDRTGAVRDEDFYRLTVRFEVLQQIESILMSRALARGEQLAHFGPDAYAAVTYRG